MVSQCIKVDVSDHFMDYHYLYRSLHGACTKKRP